MFSRCNGKPWRTFGRLAWNMKLRCKQQGVWWNPFVKSWSAYICISYIYIYLHVYIYSRNALCVYTYMYSLWRVISDGFYWVCSWAILFSSFWGKRSAHFLWRAKKLFLSATSRSSWWQLDSYFFGKWSKPHAVMKASCNIGSIDIREWSLASPSQVTIL